MLIGCAMHASRINGEIMHQAITETQTPALQPAVVASPGGAS
jgi:hypothetical protein